MSSLNNAKALALAVITTWLVGCVTTENFEATLNSWMGKDIQRIISAWGEPKQKIPASNGDTIYVYDAYKNCVVYFEVDENMKIVKWRHEGNNCQQ